MNEPFANLVTLTQAVRLSGLSYWKLKRLFDSGRLGGCRSPRGERLIDRAHLLQLTTQEVTL